MFTYPTQYDVLVVGAGHAGVEAACAAARLGARTALLTQNLDTIAQMSCNPAIGGLAKGHLVREIDALGGMMGLNTDACSIQSRMLNSGKGPSVRAPRAQCDKKAYQYRMKWLLESMPNLDLHQANVAEILTKDDCITGVRTGLGMILSGKTLVLSAGTFMKALMHVGDQNQKGGRMGEGSSTVSDSLKNFGFELGRFKTGTPCRLKGPSLNFSEFEAQGGDDPVPKFSFLADTITKEKHDIFTLNPWGDPMFHMEQIKCWIGYTNENTHQIIRDNLHLSPMYSGKIDGVGPRYCPSVEDKVVRFAEKDRHQIFLEPEGWHSHEYYVNGISTSLPYSAQYEFVRSIKGLENAEIIRPGYAVEYDYVIPTQLYPSLETKKIGGLFFAGQINGTSGYEEAAGQGLLAGVNAALKADEKGPWTIGRDEGYLGVMVDDLITKGVTEPYRLFTSRAEYRLHLRQDNADLRLTPRGKEIGLVCEERIKRQEERSQVLEQARQFCAKAVFEGDKIDTWFRKNGNDYTKLSEEIQSEFAADHWPLIETELKYAGHFARQQQQIDRMKRMENQKLPQDLDFSTIQGLKTEAKQKLNEIRPATLGQASRISGINPADVSLLSIWLQKSMAKKG